MVRETHRNYRDSSGQESLGVSRHIGDRGRSVVAERAVDGRETRTNNLINIEDGTAFDREWRSNAGANAVTRFLGSARGAALIAAAEHGLAIYEYAPREIKQAAVGRGAAAKEHLNGGDWA